MRAIIVLTIFILVSLCSAFDLSPSNPSSGDRITLSGSASPGELLSFRSSFSMNLPVSGGQYEYETAVEIPQKPNRFAVTAKNVKNLGVGVKMGIWITKEFPASSGTASISHADVPPGRYNLKMYGEALPGSSSVPVEVVAETSAEADSQGKYVLVIDTTGIPAGDYRIEGAGNAKTIRTGGTLSPPLSQDNEGEDAGVSLPDQKEAQVEITPEVIRWYAAQIGLKIQNQSQYDEAVGLLHKRLSGGYWRVIARGQPLAEEAGDCEQVYCLVRGADACTVCREKDMLIRNKSSVSTATKEVGSSLSISVPSTGEPQKDLMGWIIYRIKEWLGMHP